LTADENVSQGLTSRLCRSSSEEQVIDGAALPDELTEAAGTDS
jgi:hypothetical protein